MLTSGLDNTSLSKSIAVGIVVGLFPMLGTHTLLATLYAYKYRINLPTTFLFSSILFPLLPVIIYIMVHIGNLFVNIESANLSLEAIKNAMDLGWRSCLELFGAATIVGLLGWAIIAYPMYHIVRITSFYLLFKFRVE